MGREPDRIRILLADPDPGFCDDLRCSLESEHDFAVVGEALNIEGAVKVLRSKRVDVVLIDFALAQKSELKDLNGICAPRIVVLAAEIHKDAIVEAFGFGAHGVVARHSPRQSVHKSIRGVMAGQYWLARESVGILVEALRDSLARGNGAKSAKDYGLTRREVDIITKIASGRSNKEVSEDFAISERTVKHHLTNIFGKVGVTSRLQLALFAVNQHLMAEQPLVQSAQSDDEA